MTITKIYIYGDIKNGKSIWKFLYVNKNKNPLPQLINGEEIINKDIEYISLFCLIESLKWVLNNIHFKVDSQLSECNQDIIVYTTSNYVKHILTEWIGVWKEKDILDPTIEITNKELLINLIVLLDDLTEKKINITCEFLYHSTDDTKTFFS